MCQYQSMYIEVEIKIISLESFSNLTFFELLYVYFSKPIIVNLVIVKH